MEELNLRGLTACLSKAALAEGTTVTFTTTGTATYCIKGKAYTKAAVTNTAIGTATDATTGAAFVAQAALTACVYVYGWNAAGTSMAAQGTTVSIDAAGNYIEGTPEFPTLPEDFCPAAYILVKNAAAAATWTFGTTNWTTTSVTTGFQDVITLPTRPQSLPATS